MTLKTMLRAASLLALLFCCHGKAAEQGYPPAEPAALQAQAPNPAETLTISQTGSAEPPAPLPTDLPSDNLNAIIGTWISEKDKDWEMIFTAERTCLQYYAGMLKDTAVYRISNTSPQCGENVPVEATTSYLELKDTQSGDRTCYEINGITDHVLSLRVVHLGGAMVFRRQ